MMWNGRGVQNGTRDAWSKGQTAITYIITMSRWPVFDNTDKLLVVIVLPLNRYEPLFDESCYSFTDLEKM